MRRLPIKRCTPNSDYYKSTHWKQFIKDFWSTHNRCELCGAVKWKLDKEGHKIISKRRFVVHHKNYKHLWKESEEDVMGLCARCHNLFHDITRMKVETDAIRELKEVATKYFPYDKGDSHVR